MGVCRFHLNLPVQYDGSKSRMGGGSCLIEYPVKDESAHHKCSLPVKMQRRPDRLGCNRHGRYESIFKQTPSLHIGFDFIRDKFEFRI